MKLHCLLGQPSPLERSLFQLNFHMSRADTFISVAILDLEYFLVSVDFCLSHYIDLCLSWINALYHP